MNFNTINQRITSTDYGFNLPTFLSLVPGVSLYVQTMKVDSLLRSWEAKFDPQKDDPASFKGSLEDVKIDKIYKWHAFISIIEALALEVLFVLSSSLFIIPCAVAFYQFGDSLIGYMGFRRVVQVSLKNGFVHVER